MKMSVFFHKKSVNCNQGSVRAVRYNVDGSYLLTCGSDKKLKLWNPLTGMLLKTYGGHGDEVTDACGSCDSCHIVSASLDKSIIYWDVTTAQPIRRLRYHAGGVTCIRFNEDSGLAISGSRDNLVMCWDIRTRNLEPIQVMNDAKDCITSIIVTDHQIIASSLDSCIRRYDIRAAELISDEIGPPIIYVCQTKDGQCLVGAFADNVIRLIDNDSGDMLAQYKGHRADDFQIECGILSNDSQIVSGSAEGCAVLWDLVEEKEIGRLKIGSGVVHSLTTHPTKNDIIFANRREFQVWGSD